MATRKNDGLRRTADEAAKMLQVALDIVEGKLGAERARADSVLVAEVLRTLARRRPEVRR